MRSFSFYEGFLSWTLATHRTVGEGTRPSLFHSATSTRSQKFRHILSTLYVRWLSHILIAPLVFTRLLLNEIVTTLLNYHLIDWWCDVNFCLFAWGFDSRFLLQQFEMRNLWTQSSINYHPCITSEPTNQVC